MWRNITASAWTVTRRGGVVRIDVAEAAWFDLADVEAIAGVVSQSLAEERAKEIQFGGEVLSASHLPDEVILLTQYLSWLARQERMRFDVGPI